MTKADDHQTRLRVNPAPVPDGTVAQVNVVVFDDDSVHVGGSAMATSEEYMVACLQSGLEVMGYRVTLDRDLTLVDGVTLHHPLDSLASEAAVA